jgi:acetyl-CoA C-acetyltransferase
MQVVVEEWIMSTSAVILSTCRTPIGRFLGGLVSVPAPELGAVAAREALRRAGVEPERVDEVIIGNVLSAGVGQAPARQVALKAGLPPSVAALTVNKVCGSGLKAVMLGDQAIRAGDAEIVLAGGIESMSRAPHLLLGGRTGLKFGDQKLIDSMVHDGLWCAFAQWHMGSAAEHTARKFGIPRGEQDEFAVESHRRAVAAMRAGRFDSEIVPVQPAGRRDSEAVRQDEGPRGNTSLERLSGLKPAFDAAGTVTPGNASMLSDGAAAVVVASEAAARSRGTRPLARIVATAVAGVEPKELFIAPVPAVRRVLDKAGLRLEDIDLFEINEAFAAQMLACIRQLDLDPARVNVHGGAIALGHPIGASGARVLVTLLHALEQHNQRRGLASLCLGGGNAVAMIVERVG